MPLVDEASGRLTLGGGVSLQRDMSKSRVIELFTSLVGAKPNCDLSRDDLILPFPAVDTAGGRLAPICQIQGGRLRAVELWAYPAGKGDSRAMLLRLLMAKDPSPDTRGAVEISFPFGTALLSCDPRTNRATLLITYR